MPDKEKVIHGLECCMIPTDDPRRYLCKCTACSYTNDDVVGQRCQHELMDDALALLKEQEAEIRQLRLALDIAKGTCKGIVVECR